MSELKAYIGPAPDEKGLADYYLKSEADKVIAEKDKEIAELKIYADEVNKDFEIVDNQNERLLKIVRHNKRKRCLAMAKVCYLRFVRYENYLQKLCASNATIAAYKFRRDMYDKWEKRWRELAEEPTWAKFLQLIHKEAK